MKTKIIRKWYSKLQFPYTYNKLFERLLTDNLLEITDTFSDNTRADFLSALLQCEKLEQKYIIWGIDLDILDATLSDVKIWTDIWYELTGELGLKETDWLSNHFSGRLFRLGRLQFCMGEAMQNIAQRNIERGAPVIEIHIPAGESMDYEMCKESIKRAQKFFKEYFPDFRYECFTCHSWLLDKNLEQFLDADSNILAFQKLYDVVSTEESDALLKYVFGWNASRDNLREYSAKSSLAKQVKACALNGKKFYVPYGVLDESKIL